LISRWTLSEVIAMSRRQVKFLTGVALASFVVGGCADSSGPVDIPNANVVPTLVRRLFVPGRAAPWDMAFADDGTMFFTEKCGGLSVRHTNGTIIRLFGASGALPAADLVCQGQSGVHGVALDPSFDVNRLIYVFMTSSLSTPRTNRVVRLELDAGYTTAGNRVDIVTDIAFKDTANAVSGAGAHSGGRIRFGPDSYLYITTGDNHNALVPQSPTLLGGKVLRVTTSGTAAPGNNPPAGFDSRIYSYGHRNVQGIDFRPGTGQPYIAEHGPNHSDEVTAIIPGANGGWDPQNRATLTCPDNYCGYAGNSTSMPMTDIARFPAATPAVWTNNGSSQGLGPATFLRGEQWGAWNGRLAVGIMGGQRLVILELNAAGALVGTTDATLTAARYRSLVQGPDGNLYIATDAGEIWRVVPTFP
jgi:glucose/arabinose dehydrogenase